MPKAYPHEFRARAVALVRSGRSVAATAADLGISEAGLFNWVKQDRIDRGEIQGVSSGESVELRRAHKRIRELERELEILKHASKILDAGELDPKGFTQ